MFKLTECGHKYVGELWTAIKYISLAEHHLPVSGAISDQSSWFIDAWMCFRSELSKIHQEELSKWQTT